jgi:hypothetical protein
MPEKISWVKALQEYFTKPPHGKKIEVPEFKALSFQDKLDFREMLIAEGYDVMEVTEAAKS